MAIQLQLRRGPEEDHQSFIGAPGEVTVDTTKNTLRVHDGVTPGGHELSKVSLSNALITKSLTPSLSGQIDIGTITNKWRDLFLTNSIKLGSANITQNSDGGLTIQDSLGTYFLNQSLGPQDSPTFSQITLTNVPDLTPGTYGSGDYIPTLEINSSGFITSATQTQIKKTYVIVDNIEQRDSLELASKYAGMIVLTKDTNTFWQLKNDLQTWIVFAANYKRKTETYQLGFMATEEFIDFVLPIGNSMIVYAVTVSHPCTLEIFDDSLREQSNPYTFIATEDHLSDDGSSLLSDGSIFRGRRYYIWSNIDDSNTIYGRVTNTNSSDIEEFSITITYLPLEIFVAL